MCVSACECACTHGCPQFRLSPVEAQLGGACPFIITQQRRQHLCSVPRMCLSSWAAGATANGQGHCLRVHPSQQHPHRWELVAKADPWALSQTYELETPGSPPPGLHKPSRELSHTLKFGHHAEGLQKRT